MATKPPTLRPASVPTLRPKKRADRYYLSPAWLALRAACLQRDNYRCTMPNCRTGRSARLVVDHIVERKHGGTDTLDNVRVVCWSCHERVHKRPADKG